jgi:site-specific DNA recombinase
MKALIYCRNSKGVERSVEEQETEGRAVCAREGWEVAHVVVDRVGASRHSRGERAGWKRTTALVEHREVDVLVTWESSRAQRDLEAYVDLRRICVDSGVLWSYSGRLYDMDDHDDRFRTALDALLAEREADEIAARVQRAVRANAVAGRPHGRRLFGYQRVYDPETGGLVNQVPHPDEAPIVRRIYSDYLAGAGVRTIARRLNEEGVTTNTGARWSDMRIRDVLTRPAYTALRVHRGEVIGDASWPALIDRATFDRVQARLKAKRTSNTMQSRTANLLSGVARCGVCRGKMHRGHDRNHRKTYLCRDRFCVARDLTKIDAYVTSLLLDRLADPALPALFKGSVSPEVIAARDELAGLRSQMDQAFAEFTAGRMTAALLGRVEADLEPRIKAAEATARRVVIPLDITLPDDGDLVGWWKALTPEYRREIASAWIEHVWVLPTQRGRRTFDPDAVKIDWRA